MKTKDETLDDDIPAEIDFSGGVRGKHAAQYALGTNLVRIDSDLMALFPTSEAVNAALRLLADVARRQTGALPMA